MTKGVKKRGTATHFHNSGCSSIYPIRQANRFIDNIIISAIIKLSRLIDITSDRSSQSGIKLVV